MSDVSKIPCSFIDYSMFALKTSLPVPESVHPLYFDCANVASEAHEGLEKIKKVLRDRHGCFNPSDIAALMLEAGDALWYLNRYAEELRHRMSLFSPREVVAVGLTHEQYTRVMRQGRGLDIIAVMNLMKLRDRAERGAINGEGDGR